MHKSALYVLLTSVLRPANIQLTAEEQSVLESWVRSSKTEQRMVLWPHVALVAVEGQETVTIDIKKPGP